MRFSRSTAAAWPEGFSASVALASCASKMSSLRAAILALISAATSFPADFAALGGWLSALNNGATLAPLAGPPWPAPLAGALLFGNRPVTGSRSAISISCRPCASCPLDYLMEKPGSLVRLRAQKYRI